MQTHIDPSDLYHLYLERDAMARDDEARKEACPVCHSYVDPEELDDNFGICNKCAETH